MDAEILFRLSADYRAKESAIGRYPSQCCEASLRGYSNRDQMVSAIFGRGIGPSDPEC